MPTDFNFILLSISFTLVVILFIMYVVFVKLRDGEKDKQLVQLTKDVRRLSNTLSQARAAHNKWMAQLQFAYSQVETERSKLKVYQQVYFDADLYKQVLSINDTQRFFSLVNEKLYSYYDRLIEDYPNLSEKESCLSLLILMHIPDNVICILLNYSSNSLPTIKNRLCKKLNVKHAKSLQDFLENRLD